MLSVIQWLHYRLYHMIKCSEFDLDHFYRIIFVALFERGGVESSGCHFIFIIYLSSLPVDGKADRDSDEDDPFFNFYQFDDEDFDVSLIVQWIYGNAEVIRSYWVNLNSHSLCYGFIVVLFMLRYSYQVSNIQLNCRVDLLLFFTGLFKARTIGIKTSQCQRTSNTCPHARLAIVRWW